MKFPFNIEKVGKQPWIATLLAILGGCVYLVLSMVYAHSQISILDEGAYLLKGYLFAVGEYKPFQDYGPWTNHMPFSYLIPGWVQVLFGPGLRTGRYLAVVLGLGMITGLWLVTKRLSNRWWAAALVWMVALNVPVLKVYNVMTSQVLVSFILVWIFVLTLGSDRSELQINLGVFLAGILMLTRINMSPVLPLLLIYIFWEHGTKTGLWAAFTGIITVASGHALFWPEILKLWAAKFPISFQFFEPWKASISSTPLWQPDISLDGRIYSFLLNLRIHFTPVVGILLATLMWPPKRVWRSGWRLRTAVFLWVTFVFLFAIHAWASLGQNYCVFCLPNYLMFFHIVGLLFLCVVFTSWPSLRVPLKNWASIPLMVVFLAGAGYSAINGRQISSTWIGGRLSELLELFWNIQVPRIREMRIVPGTGPLWGLLANKLGWTEKAIAEVTLLLVLVILSWIVMLLISKLLSRELSSLPGIELSASAVLVISFLLVGTIMTLRLGFVPQDSDCNGDVIAAYEAAGEYLDAIIEPGSKIYWRGTSAVPLLYLNDFEIYPPQINDVYSYFIGGDPDVLYRHGRWNPELDLRWQQDADYLLIEGTRGIPDIQNYDELQPSIPVHPCNPDTKIHIYDHQ